MSPPNSAAERLDKAKATEHQFAQDARNRGAEVFEFDPKATTEQKTTQVKKVHSEIFSEVFGQRYFRRPGLLTAGIWFGV